MKYLLLITMLFIAVATFTCTSPPLSMDINKTLVTQNTENKLWLQESKDIKAIHEEIDIELVKAPEIDRTQMIEDIIQVWEMFLDDAECKQRDPRRMNFSVFAEELADAIIMYQNNPTDIGGQLPKDRNIHILMAVIVTKESSIVHNAVGAAPRFEVGLMQIHGVALAGYNPDLVQHSSRLGLLLGVRWFAAQMDDCKIHRIPGDNQEWRVDDLVGPMSVYAGGSKAIKKNGTCFRYKVARERVNLTKLYLTRIIAASNA